MQDHIPSGSPLVQYWPPPAPPQLPPIVAAPRTYPTIDAPAAPPFPMAAQLPKAPPGKRKRPRVNMFDKEHWRDSLFAIGTGMLSGGNDFGASLAGAAKNLQAAREGFIAEEAPPKTEIGGPDDAFEITIDPQTGERTFEPIQAFQDYASAKAKRERQERDAPKPEDKVKMRGSVMESMLRVPAEQRAAAYAQFLRDSSDLGYGDLGLPETWDDTVAGIYRDQAMGPKDRMDLDVSQGRLMLDRYKFDREFPLRQQNVQSQIGSRASANQARAAAGSRAERKLRSAPPSTRRGSASSPPPGFVLD